MAKKLGQSKVLSGSGVISTAGKSAVVRAVTLCSGTTDSSILIENGGSGGAEMWRMTVNGTTAAGEVSYHQSFPGTGIVCTTDAYGTLAGTGAVASILYDEIES